jgi:hypothetical protein
VIEQLPSADLAKEIGVVPWLLMLVVSAGAGMVGFFLRRMTQAMDRMAEAQETTPVVVAEIKTLLVERLDRLEGKMDAAVELGTEHVRIARMWEKTEAPGRVVRDGPPG